jgi:D-sedoheptulose 7-phosphate isomerase
MINEEIKKRELILPEVSRNQKNIEMIVDSIISVIQRGGTVYTCGNGGSSASATHLCTELMVRYKKERLPIHSICLNSNTSNITAICNDYGQEYIFSRQIQGITTDRDIVMVYSTSGRSPNIINAAKIAHEQHSTVIAFIGGYKVEIYKYSDIILAINTIHTPVIQEFHDTINHIICEMLESIDTDVIKKHNRTTY